MRIADPFIQELEMESQITQRVLERLPVDKFSWKPHPKSMSLGQLGLHVAQVPAFVTQMVTPDVMEGTPPGGQAEATSRAELLDTLSASVATAKAYMNSLTDQQMMATWTFKIAGKVIMALPRMGVIRMIMLNHAYHHRGQLLVYLRLLNESVPSVYGPTADENPFMG